MADKGLITIIYILLIRKIKVQWKKRMVKAKNGHLTEKQSQMVNRQMERCSIVRDQGLHHIASRVRLITLLVGVWWRAMVEIFTKTNNFLSIPLILKPIHPSDTTSNSKSTL